MSFSSQWNLKWLDPVMPTLHNSSFTVINKIVFLVREKSDLVVGLTVAEPRDLSDTFFDRLAKRTSALSGRDLRFELVSPAFTKHRIQPYLEKLEYKDLTLTISPFMRLEWMANRFRVRSRMHLMNVDDSPVLLKLLKQTLTQMNYVEVIAQVSDPLKAVDQILAKRPDVITMDIQMPGKTGVQVVRELLAKEEFPVIMVSSLSPEDGSLVFDALNSGAFDYIQKPKIEDLTRFQEELSSKLLLAADVKDSPQPKRTVIQPQARAPHHQVEFPKDALWCLGASTGGTQALTRVFTSLPTHIPPTLVVQHIPPVFSKAFADSLAQLCPFKVKEAEHNEKITANCIYIAPGGTQMGVRQTGEDLYIEITNDDPVNRFRPSVDYLFRSAAKIKGRAIVSGILTGMGKDGAEGLLALRNADAKTFAQDEKTSVVYGMPRAAMENGAAASTVALDAVASHLVQSSSPDQTKRKAS
jgi:two-component system chemotaxis response regulator CheB